MGGFTGLLSSSVTPPPPPKAANTKCSRKIQTNPQILRSAPLADTYAHTFPSQVSRDTAHLTPRCFFFFFSSQAAPCQDCGLPFYTRLPTHTDKHTCTHIFTSPGLSQNLSNQLCSAGSATPDPADRTQVSLRRSRLAEVICGEMIASAVR